MKTMTVKFNDVASVEVLSATQEEVARQVLLMLNGLNRIEASEILQVCQKAVDAGSFVAIDFS